MFFLSLVQEPCYMLNCASSYMSGSEVTAYNKALSTPKPTALYYYCIYSIRLRVAK